MNRRSEAQTEVTENEAVAGIKLLATASGIVVVALIAAYVLGTNGKFYYESSVREVESIPTPYSHYPGPAQEPLGPGYYSQTTGYVTEAPSLYPEILTVGRFVKGEDWTPSPEASKAEAVFSSPPLVVSMIRALVLVVGSILGLALTGYKKLSATVLLTGILLLALHSFQASWMYRCHQPFEEWCMYWTRGGSLTPFCFDRQPLSPIANLTIPV